MRIAFIGCVKFSHHTFKHLISTLKNAEIVGVITRRSSKFNADFVSLESLAVQIDCPCFIAEKNDQVAMAKWLQVLQPDIVFCFGWSYLLKKEILRIPPLGIIGYHPAALPQNRGRHPIIWALALGLPQTASTFFFMDEGADSGPILNQKFIDILPKDDAASLYQKLIDAALEQMTVFIPQLVSGRFPKISQDHTQVNYWRKRNKEDGRIDWRISAQTLYNLIRALTHPYVGAHCNYREQEVKIWKSVLLEVEEEWKNLEPGKVIRVRDNCITVKCGEKALRIVEHEFDALPEIGEYL